MMQILRYGLLTILIVCGGTQATPADEPVRIKTAAVNAEVKQTFEGLTFEHWLEAFQTELEPGNRYQSLSALVTFGRNGKAETVVPLILDVLDDYNMRVSLALAEGFDEGQEEFQKPLSEGKLPPGFGALGFSGVDDLRLFMAANQSLMRLAPRAIPLLVKHLESEGRLSCSRMAAMRAIAMEAQAEWLRLMPQLVARDSLTASMAMHFFSENEFFVDSAEYEECLAKLLDVKSSRNHVVIVQALANDKYVALRKPILSLLQDLQKKSTDDKVQAVIKHALTRIPRDPEEKSVVVPASVKEQAEYSK